MAYIDSLLPSALSASIILICSIAALAFGVFQWTRVSKTSIKAPAEVLEVPSTEALLSGDTEQQRSEKEVFETVAELQEAISEGSNSFLWQEYQYMSIFASCFSLVILVLLSSKDGFSCKSTTDDGIKHLPAYYSGIFTTIAFLIGALTSVVSGFIGMRIAVYANARTTLEARQSIAAAFAVAFKSGSVMGFTLAGLGLLVLFVLISAYAQVFGDDWSALYATIAGYGLGGSSMALFMRVGGGIYTKAADVGADLVGKIEKDIPEDDARNPAVIADNVGDNVGDVAAMGADLFGSFAEATCAALVLLSASSIGADHNFSGMCFPLLISAVGMAVGIFVTFLGTDVWPALTPASIEPTLKNQLIFSTALATPAVLAVCLLALPAEFSGVFTADPERAVRNWEAFVCVAVGLWGGLIIGLSTEYFTSNRFHPVQEVARACKTGAATDIIFGLALGYKSAIIPSIAIATAIFVGFSLAHMLGVAFAALGVLTTLSTGLSIDAYGPISDNAGGIAEMAGLGEDIRSRTDALDAAGNTTAAIGKGFAIGSAALVSLALFGGYVVQAELGLQDLSLLDPQVLAGLLIGAMLPYWFSSMTMKSVGKAALAMVEEVRRQFRETPGIMDRSVKPDYSRCVAISTAASLKEMIPPGALVLLTPLVVGALFGVRSLGGVLAGSLVSGVQMAVSMSNSGGAFDNAKKYLEAGNTEEAREIGGKGTDAHKAAVVGDTLGDPLKDTSGPSLNILIKLMAVESLVFAPFFAAHTPNGLIFQYFNH